jgi:hypothetical protein
MITTLETGLGLRPNWNVGIPIHFELRDLSDAL